jgi:hypothetical protein
VKKEGGLAQSQEYIHTGYHSEKYANILHQSHDQGPIVLPVGRDNLTSGDSSRMRRKLHVRFLGGGGAAMRCCYPTIFCGFSLARRGFGPPCAYASGSVESGDRTSKSKNVDLNMAAGEENRQYNE